MKIKQTILTLALVCATCTSFAQEYRIDFGVGFKTTKSTAKSVYFDYTDESPSMDNILADFEIPDVFGSPTLNLGFAYEGASTVFAKIDLSIKIGTVSGVDTRFLVGKTILTDHNPKVRLYAGLGFGSNGFKLGDIYQNDVYIEVNGQQFYSNSVSVRLEEKYTALHIGSDAVWSLSDELAFTAGISYLAPMSNNTPYLKFSGQDLEQKDVYATESISAPNVYLSVNNERIKKSLVDAKGLNLALNLVYIF